MIDEAHLNSGPETRLVKTVLTFKNACKWFLTGTSFESSSRQLVGWISPLQINEWSKTKPTPFQLTWPRGDEYLVILPACTQSAVKKLGLAHDTLIRGKLGVRSKGVLEHVTNLFIVLKTLYLKRSATEILWFGQPLITVPLNIH